MNNLLRARIWPSFSPSCRLYPPGRSPLRDGVEPEAWRPRVSAPATYRSVRLGFDFGFWISDLRFLSTIDDIELTVQISPFVLWFSRAFQQIFNPHSAMRIPQSSTRWHTHLRGLATAIHKISGLGTGCVVDCRF